MDKVEIMTGKKEKEATFSFSSCVNENPFDASEEEMKRPRYFSSSLAEILYLTYYSSIFFFVAKRM